MCSVADERMLASRRAQFIEAASKCFARKGYHRTTVHDIAREAGVADGTLYRYFEGKKDLLAAMIAGGSDGAFEAVSGSAGENLDEQYRTFFLRHLERFRSNPELAKVLIGETIFDPELAGVMAASKEERHRLAVESLARHIAGGRLSRDADPELVARFTISLVIGYLLVWEIGATDSMPRHDPHAVAEAMASLVLHGLKP